MLFVCVVRVLCVFVVCVVLVCVFLACVPVCWDLTAGVSMLLLCECCLQANAPSSALERTVAVWGDEVSGAVDQGDAAARWLSDVLGASVRLVYFDQVSGGA